MIINEAAMVLFGGTHLSYYIQSSFTFLFMILILLYNICLNFQITIILQKITARML